MTTPIYFTVEKTDTGYSAYSEEYPVYSTGSTLTELRSHLQEALELYYEDEPHFSVSAQQIEFYFDIQQFFSYFQELNVSAIGKRIGMSQSLLSQYATGAKRPSPKQAERILEGIRELGQELASSFM